MLDSLWMMRFPMGWLRNSTVTVWPSLDLDGLGRIIQQIARLGAGLLDDQCGPRLHPLHQEGAGGVRHELAVVVTHHRAVRSRH